jgi:hypothetical protein
VFRDDLIQNGSIRLGEWQIGQLGGSNPAKRFTRRSIGIGRCAAEKVQLDAIMRIIVPNDRALVDDLRSQPSLLETLAGRGCFRRFAGLHFASGKLPQASQRHIRRTLPDQKTAIVLDDGNGDPSSRIGHGDEFEV